MVPRMATDIPDGWTTTDDGSAIERTFRFADFATAFAFMAGVAPSCERADHHPEWANTWNTVEVRLTTHDAGGLTEKDTDLAAVMNRQAALLDAA